MPEPIDIAAIQARCEAVTPEEIKACRFLVNDWCSATEQEFACSEEESRRFYDDGARVDAIIDFAEAAISDVPALLAEVEQLRAALGTVRAIALANVS